jgi:hypothetical protein
VKSADGVKSDLRSIQITVLAAPLSRLCGAHKPWANPIFMRTYWAYTTLLYARAWSITAETAPSAGKIGAPAAKSLFRCGAWQIQLSNRIRSAAFSTAENPAWTMGLTAWQTAF